MSDTKTTFTSTAKQSSRGISYAVFANGKEIGSRTTGKRTGFRLAVVARRNYAWTCANTRQNLKHHQAELAKHEGYLADPQSALAAERQQYHRDLLSKWICDGTVDKWIIGDKASITNLTARLLELSGLSQESPEFKEWLVLGFSNTGKETPKDWNYDFQFVTLTQPAGVEAV